MDFSLSFSFSSFISSFRPVVAFEEEEGVGITFLEGFMYRGKLQFLLDERGLTRSFLLLNFAGVCLCVSFRKRILKIFFYSLFVVL